MYYKALQWSYENVPAAAGLSWDENNVEHLWRSHRVAPDEVEEAVLGVDGEEARFLRVRDGEYWVFLGMTADGRLLSMAGEYLDDGRLYIFSARDMNAREKRRFRRV